MIGMVRKRSQRSSEVDIENAEAAVLEKHRIPAIDRMMDVLGHLERRPGGATIRDLVDMLGLPRTTVYRVLNSLQSHEMVRRSPDGVYTLGRRLLALAARVVTTGQDYDLASLAMPHLERLSEELGESSKISVFDNDGALVIAAVQGKREFALTVVPGQRLPLHAGAASKILLAHLPAAELKDLIRAPLAGYTGHTITDAKRLTRDLAEIRSKGWAADKGEYAVSVHAFAAPIPDRTGKTIAALSVPFLAGADTQRMERIRAAVIAAAGAIAADLPAPRHQAA
jgi:DNA-binding IclR family transcriptional regulator